MRFSLYTAAVAVFAIAGATNAVKLSDDDSTNFSDTLLT